MKVTFTLVILLALFTKITPSNAQVNYGDSLSLVNLYTSTNGPGWLTSTGWLTSSPVSTWAGITVSGGRVTQIELAYFQLSGPLPASIGYLSALTSLDLSFNELTDTIPASVGYLVNLVALNFSNNSLVGNIPSSIGSISNLTNLAVYSNNLTGGIPSTIGNLTKLSVLHLDGNALTGPIPSSIQQLTNLVTLGLSHNKLSGAIPASTWNNLTLLQTLNLSYNQFSGSIPLFGALAALTSLNLSHNNLSGSIPATSSLCSPYIGSIELDDNQLTGSIPASLGQYIYANSLTLSNNQLTGPIPSSLGGLSSAAITVQNNQLNFDDVQQFVKNNPSINLTYAPQANITLHSKGNILSVYGAGSSSLANNTYNWYRGGVHIASIPADSSLVIALTGSYAVAVTNSIATKLTLYSDTLIVSSLPLTLLNFRAELQKSTALLSWQTTSEINTSYFGVERSTDGASFTTVGQVYAAGNSTGLINYAYNDNIAAFVQQYPAVFYRLKEVDKDGHFTYSPIVRLVLAKGAFSFIITPNPVQSTLNLQLNSYPGQTMITLIDMQGRKLQSKIGNEGTQSMQFDISSLAAGVYIIQVENNGQKQVQKFVKE